MGKLRSDAGIARSVVDALDGRTEPGRRAREIRKALGRSRTKVARSAGLTRHQLARTERGRRPVAAAQWRSLAGSLGVDPELLLPADECPPNDLDAENRKIDEFLDHDVVQGWALAPTMATDRTAARLIDLAEEERHDSTGAVAGRSWRDIRADLDELVACCDRLVAAEAAEDAGALLDMLEAAADEVRFRSPSDWVVVDGRFDALSGHVTTKSENTDPTRPTLPS